MFMTCLCAALLGIAAFLQFALDQAPDLEDSHDNKAARRVLIAGLLMLFLWVLHRSYQGCPVHPLPLFGLMLVVLAEIAFCINRLFPEFGCAIARTPLRKSRTRRRETAK